MAAGDREQICEMFCSWYDPWGYEVIPFALEKFQAAIDLLVDAPQRCVLQVSLEIGAPKLNDREACPDMRTALCGLLHPPALERARVRCVKFGNVSFSKWDLESDKGLAHST